MLSGGMISLGRTLEELGPKRKFIRVRERSPTASVSSASPNKLDIGCLSAYFEPSYNAFAPSYARGRQCSAVVLHK